MKACDGDVRCNVQTYCLLHVFLYMLLMREWMYIYMFVFGHIKNIYKLKRCKNADRV